jgi:hypothetical protein
VPLYRETSTEFHPEFGYLVPTRKLRGTMRVALAAAVFGVIMGAVGVMVLVPRIARDLRIAHAASGEPAVTVGAAIASPPETTGPMLATDGSAGQSLPAAATGRRFAAPKGGAAAAPSAADADKPCKEETWPYFDSKCLWGGPAKDSSAAVLSAEAPPVAAAGADVAPAAANPPQQRQVAAKKKVRTTVARRRKEEPDPRTAYVNPYANPYSNSYGSWRGGGYEPRRDWGWSSW